jgi:hypothetical protein
MNHLYEVFPIILLGVLVVTLIDVVGSITSRKLNYPYVYLIPPSLLVYTLIGYFVARNTNQTWAILSASLVGIYEGIIGWKLSILLKANFGGLKENNAKMTAYSRIVGMIGIGAIFGFIGYILQRI